jgi:hypothetical protein
VGLCSRSKPKRGIEQGTQTPSRSCVRPFFGHALVVKQLCKQFKRRCSIIPIQSLKDAAKWIAIATLWVYRGRRSFWGIAEAFVSRRVIAARLAEPKGRSKPQTEFISYNNRPQELSRFEVFHKYFVCLVTCAVSLPWLLQ